MESIADVEVASAVPVVPEGKDVVADDPVKVDEPVKDAENEFSYIDENGFTTEIFKIEIRGMPKFYGIGVS